MNSSNLHYLHLGGVLLLVVVITKIMLHLGMEMVALKAIGEPIILSKRTRRIIKEASSIKSLMQQQGSVVI